MRKTNEDVCASVLVTFVGSDEDELDQKLIRLGKIAEEAGAGFKVWRRRLYLVSKVEQYLEGLTQE